MIFLDVDEVLANWTGAVLTRLGLEPEAIYARWAVEAPEVWNLFEIPNFPVSAAEAWGVINDAGAEFWSSLEPYPWAFELFDACQAAGPTVLLTKPSRHPTSAMGKLQWMQRHFGRYLGRGARGEGFEDYLIGPPKHAVARPGAVLIDDSPRNCAAFEAHGGKAILFPSVGNRRRAHRTDPLAVVVPELQSAMSVAG